MNYQIINDRVLIKKSDDTKSTSSGIIIAKDSTDQTITGEVIAVGDGKPLDDGKIRQMTVNVGDTVMIIKSTGIEVKMNGDECIVVKEDDILLIM